VIIRIQQFELATEAVDNFVDKWFLTILTSGFYYSFVTLSYFYAPINFLLFSKTYYFRMKNINASIDSILA